MADPGAGAGGLYITSGSVRFQGHDEKVVSVGTSHLEVVTIQTSAVDGDEIITWDWTAPTSPAIKHLSLSGSDSPSGTSGTAKKCAMGVMGDGLDNSGGAGGSNSSKAWTWASWMYIPNQVEKGSTEEVTVFKFFKGQVNNSNLAAEFSVNFEQPAGQAGVGNGWLIFKMADVSGADSEIHFTDSTDANDTESKWLFADTTGLTKSWHHWALTYDGGAGEIQDRVKFYVDGALFALPYASHGTGYTGTDQNGWKVHFDYNDGTEHYMAWDHCLFFGQNEAEGGNKNDNDATACGKFKFDEMVMWIGRALTVSEVSELYNSRRPFTMTSHSQYGNLNAYWNFDSDSTFNTAATPPVKMLDKKNSNHLTSSSTILPTHQGIIQTSHLTGSYVTGSFDNQNANIVSHGEYNVSTGNLTLQTTAPFDGTINYLVLSRDFRDRGY
jgi:hypothetical protein